MYLNMIFIRMVLNLMKTIWSYNRCHGGYLSDDILYKTLINVLNDELNELNAIDLGIIFHLSNISYVQYRNNLNNKWSDQFQMIIYL